MSNPPLFRRLLCLVAFMLTLTSASEAQAARGVMLINTGEDVMKIAEMPQETRELLAEAGVSGRPEIGVMYSRFGVFWLDIVRWNPQYVIFTDDGMDGFSYELVTVDELAEVTGMSASEFTKPIRYYLPPGGVLIGLLVLLGVPYGLYASKQDDQKKAALRADPRYQAAVAAYENVTQMPDAGERIDAAMKILTSQGIPNQEARDNLVLLCDIATED